MGYFKGIIEVQNKEEEEQLRKELKTEVDKIWEQLSALYQKVCQKQFGFKVEELKSFDKARDVWSTVYKELPDCYSIKDSINFVFYREKIKQEL